MACVVGMTFLFNSGHGRCQHIHYICFVDSAMATPRTAAAVFDLFIKQMPEELLKLFPSSRTTNNVALDQVKAIYSQLPVKARKALPHAHAPPFIAG